MLWYLVIPPFVVVISLGILLWLLSRRAGEEEVSRNLSLAKAETMSGAQSRSLSRRAFLLKLVEKTASRFKTVSLRIHNFFQHGLERIRKRRGELEAIRRNMEENPDGPESVGNGKRRRFGMPSIVRKDDPMPESGTTQPDISGDFSAHADRKGEGPEREAVKKADLVKPKSARPPASGSRKEPVVATGSPTLRGEATNPDVRTGRSEKDPREVELLSRIVENPRDTSAYEELGDWYFAERNMEDAKECYRQALKLHPTNRAVKIKIRKLEKFFEGRGK